MFFEYLYNLQNPCKVYTKDSQGYISAKNKFQGIVGRYRQTNKKKKRIFLVLKYKEENR